MLAGVSGGLANYFEIHPAFYRVGFVVLTLLGGAGLLIYLVAAIVMPDEGQEDSIASAALKSRRDRPWPLIGLGLVVVAACRSALACHAVAAGRRVVRAPGRRRCDSLDHAARDAEREHRRSRAR
jgi:phage shock protein C